MGKHWSWAAGRTVVSMISGLITAGSFAIDFAGLSSTINLEQVKAFAFAIFFITVVIDKFLIHREIEALKDQRATIHIVFEPVFPMWWKEQGWFRLGVRNDGPAVADDVRVRLESISPDPLNFNVLPCALGVKDAPPENIGITSIRPGVTEYFDLVSLPPGSYTLFALKTRVGFDQRFSIPPGHDGCKFSVSSSGRNTNLENRQILLRLLQPMTPELVLVKESKQPKHSLGWVPSGTVSS